MTVAGAVQGTAISVAMDMTEGIIARFRTMSIARVSVLTGHVLGSLIQAIWLSVALGQASKNVEAASNIGMPLVLLPFLGSGFVPTDSMPVGLRWFADHQPFTPIIETLRGLLFNREYTG
jgi:ABC-2 type transport system permease protein